ncbi:Secreted protein OS=Streptomyces tendae OX=1932 GN=GUR47_08435 PE=4 SV=1 [Streptomyces tendae]
MAAMRRGLVHVIAWLLATGAAVTLSWWGVHTVMAGTAYDAPRALPITAADASVRDGEGSDDGESLASSTSRPSPSSSPSPGSASPTPSGTAHEPGPAPTRTAPSATPSADPTRPAPDTSGEVKSYDTDGGRAVFDLGTSSASLVSATPGPGWSMQVWKTQSWIRVEFTSGADRVSVFCTWHDGPPRVEIGSY